MKAVFIGNDQKVARVVDERMRARWPDAIIEIAQDGTSGLELIKRILPDVVLLRPDFTDMSLSDAIGKLRSFSDVPMVVIGSKEDQAELITALETGADNYISQSNDRMNMTLRVYALLRRVESFSQNHGRQSPIRIRSSHLLIDLPAYKASMNGTRLRLSKTELSLLYLLVRNRDFVVTHAMLEQNIESNGNDNQAVKKHIQRLRFKLGDNARPRRWIASRHGVGYQFIGPAPSQTKTTEKIAG